MLVKGDEHLGHYGSAKVVLADRSIVEVKSSVSFFKLSGLPELKLLDAVNATLQLLVLREIERTFPYVTYDD